MGKAHVIRQCLWDGSDNAVNALGASLQGNARACQRLRVDRGEGEHLRRTGQLPAPQQCVEPPIVKRVQCGGKGGKLRGLIRRAIGQREPGADGLCLRILGTPLGLKGGLQGQ
ncbi:hypothetical protein GALL_432180 [mine drainage metagenome]|uniref:Uncharacterized protein n=1 Tax=mine drainage metagenome TaxID=410659 RepID=A0A1J5PVH7_9ZZZZ